MLCAMLALLAVDCMGLGLIGRCVFFLLQVPAIASVTPKNRTQPTGRSRAVFTVNLGCSAGTTSKPASVTTGSDNRVQVVINQPTVTPSGAPRIRWTARTEALPKTTTVKFSETAAVKFNVSWDRSAVSTSKVTGVMTVSNPASKPVSLGAVRVRVIASGDESASASVTSTTIASCATLELQAGGLTTCSYTVDAAAAHGTSSSGYITAVAAGKDGSLLSTSRAPFTSNPAAADESNSPAVGSTEAAAVKVKGSTESCAEIVAGVMLGSLLLMPGGAAPMASETLKVCEPGYKMLSQPVGPVPSDACGTYTVSRAVLQWVAMPD